MKKLALFVAAAAAITMITPALAQVSVQVGSGMHRDRGVMHERVIVRHRDRGLHRGWERGHHNGWRHHERRGARVIIR